MTEPTDTELYIAMNRFGLGASPRARAQLGPQPAKTIATVRPATVPDTLRELPGYSAAR